MIPKAIINISQNALLMLSYLLLIILVPALVVGVLVSVFQAATQINKMTLSFIPKLLVTLLVLVMVGPWMLRMVTEHTIKTL